MDGTINEVSPWGTKGTSFNRKSRINFGVSPFTKRKESPQSLKKLPHYSLIEKNKLLSQIMSMIKKENDQVEANKQKGKTTVAFEAHPVNLNPQRPLRDKSGRIVTAGVITFNSVAKQLQTS